MAKEKSAVEIEEPEIEGQQTLHAPYGVQDMNAPVEAEPVQTGIDEDVVRVLTDEVHVDMGRGALTFKPGDSITIRDGHIRKAVTREGMEYEFRPAHEVAKERFDADQEAAGIALAAGQAKDDTLAPAQPQDAVDDEMPAANPEPQPAEEPEPDEADTKEQPREKGKFTRKGE